MLPLAFGGALLCCRLDIIPHTKHASTQYHNGIQPQNDKKQALVLLVTLAFVLYTEAVSPKQQYLFSFEESKTSKVNVGNFDQLDIDGHIVASILCTVIDTSSD